MSNIEKYVSELNNINPDKILMENTINEIKTIDEKKFSLKRIIKTIIATISSLILCTGGAFAAMNLFDLDDKFLEFFNIESEYANKIGVKAEEVKQSAEFSNGIVTLTQMIVDSHNIYFVFDLEGLVSEDIENI